MSHDQAAFAPVVLVCEHARFAAYLAEMLYTEGLPWFRKVDTWGEAGPWIGAADVLVIPQGTADVPTVRAWLDAGGAVIAMRPPAELLGLAKLKPSVRAAAELPLRLSPPFDVGMVCAHGEVDLYEIGGDAAVEVYGHVRYEGRDYPAVVSAARGRGRLVLFAYDLPRSIALTRQGNPEWAGCRGTDFGSNTFRPADLFVRGCGAQTWLEFPSAAAPLADMQQRLLAHLIGSLARAPLPRIWYLPQAQRTVLSIVGDSDSATPEIVSEQFNDVAAVGGGMSAFLIDYTVDRTDAATVARWRAEGHEVSVHPDYGLHGDKSKPDRETMFLTGRTILERFRGRFGFLPRTVRNHSISWVGFAEQPEIERSLGIRLNSSYVYASAFAKPPYSGPPVGYLTGSGQPQKFVDPRGRVLDIYQLGVQVCDEMLKSQYLRFDADKAWRETEKLLDASRARWHSFVALSFHPVTYHGNPEAKRWLRDRILPYARRHGLPLWSTEKVLDFADARRGCWMERVEWGPGHFRGEVHAPQGSAGLTLLMPAESGGRKLTQLRVNGRDAQDPDVELADARWKPIMLERPTTEIQARYA